MKKTEKCFVKLRHIEWGFKRGRESGGKDIWRFTANRKFGKENRFGNGDLERRKKVFEVASPPQQGASSSKNVRDTRADMLDQTRPGREFVKLARKDDWTTPGGLVGSLTSCQTGQSQPGVGCASHTQGWGRQPAVGEPVGHKKP